MNDIIDGSNDVSYKILKNYIDTEMSMSDLYQSVMLIEMIKQAPGLSSLHKNEIARALLSYDEGLVEYYEKIVRTSPVPALRKRGVIDSGPKGTGLYILNGASDLSIEQRDDLIKRCEKRLFEFIHNRHEHTKSHREKGCPFCELAKPVEILDENELCFILKDKCPVTDGHCLVIPRRHVLAYFDMNQAEVNAANRLLKLQRQRLLDKDQEITGFNVGMNSGESAGQTIFHAHIHLIPRRDGDQENPRGGIRKIFPEIADYIKT